ncbi:RNA polymerase recycling motor HelD [Paenibacillus sp. MCAF20]
MSKEQDWASEQQRVDEITSIIEERIAKIEEEVGFVRKDVVEMRREFWDEVTMNFMEEVDLGETSISMRQQSEVLFEREHRHKNTAVEIKKLRKLLQSPYFGRIDFAEHGSEPERIYLGIASLLDKDDNEFLIYDWRAPISNLYYDSTPGPASYRSLNSEIEGELTLKRQFGIRDGKIRFMFDTGITIGDELLQAVLSRSADSQMKSIVGTIQKEQNRIIRDDRSQLLIVQGAAGSGKTSAALQRVAYLLYKYRGQISADQVVLFSPNPMFNSYVSTVLPELGEENMVQATFQEYLERRLGHEFKLEDPFEQLEYVLSSAAEPGYDARMEGIQFKSSDQFMQLITSYKELLLHEGMIFKSIPFRGKAVITASQLKGKFYSYDGSITLANRLALLRDWVLKAVAKHGKEQYGELWVEEQIELLDQDQYQQAYERYLALTGGDEDPSSSDNTMSERDIMARMVVSSKLKPLRKWVKALRFVDTTSLYCELFRNNSLASRLVGDVSLPPRWHELSSQTINRIKEGELAYEDSTPYLYLRELMLGFHSNNGIRYVFIDEAQDYSPFQLAFLRRLFPRAKMTALGDFNQAIYAHSSALQDAGPLYALYGPEQTELISLTRSYRSTQEIVQFTRGMVPGGEHIVPFNRSGEKPAVTLVKERSILHESLAADVHKLIDQGYESVAIICKTAKESEAAFKVLKDLLPVAPRLIKKTTPNFEKGVHIIPAYLAKGVEFDAVLIYNGSKKQYSRESERKLFYTACTRAMHLLHIYAISELTPFAASQPDDTYVRVEVREEAAAAGNPGLV